MADRPKEGYSDGSDDGGNKTLRGFVLIRKSHGEKNSNVFAEHSRFHYILLDQPDQLKKLHKLLDFLYKKVRPK